MKITEEEVAQARSVAKSRSVQNISDRVLRSLDEPSLSMIIAAFLFLKSHGRSDKDFITFLTTKEIWSTLTIALNVSAAAIPAMLFDMEFRTLAIKAAMNAGVERGAKIATQKTATKEAT